MSVRKLVRGLEVRAEGTRAVGGLQLLGAGAQGEMATTVAEAGVTTASATKRAGEAVRLARRAEQEASLAD